MRVWEVIAIREENHSEFIGGVMSSHRHNKSSEIRVELKYCEHCGGLWVRERGAGVVLGGRAGEEDLSGADGDDVAAVYAVLD
jgi:hypothetical protein